VKYANANRAVFAVLYSDGEKDNAICRICVRPETKIEIDEFVGVRKNGIFYDGRVVTIHPNELYDIDVEEIGLQRNVSFLNLRRYEQTLALGVVVEAKFQGGGNNWYPGKIARVNKDGTFDVEFFDGDKQYSVEPEHIRISS
jgi:hypothetical protein